MEPPEEFWTELGGRVRAFVGRRVNDPHAADDITQDVLLKVQARFETFPRKHAVPAWAIAAARNAVIDYYRARVVRDHADLDAVGPLAGSDPDEQQPVIRGLSRCLANIVRLLPEPFREAVRLADVEGLRQQEVADRAGISLSGAKSRVQRARRQLREMILDCCRIERDRRGNVMDYETTARTKHYCGEADE